MFLLRIDLMGKMCYGRAVPAGGRLAFHNMAGNLQELRITVIQAVLERARSAGQDHPHDHPDSWPVLTALDRRSYPRTMLHFLPEAPARIGITGSHLNK